MTQPNRTRTADEAVGRWPGILQALGVDPRFLTNRHGPCPVCKGKDRYRFDNKQGRGNWFCARCGSGDGFQLLQGVFGWTFSEAAKEVDRIVGAVQPGPIAKERSPESKLEALRNVWSTSRPVTKGDPVWLYLHRRVGLDMIPTDIRYHPALKYVDEERTVLGEYPAMLAALRYPDGKAASIHRTYLTRDGQKAPVPTPKKIMPGKPLNSASVRLSAVGPRVGIAEGIENALAASRRFLTPVWAATNAALLEAWVPPDGVVEVLICADNDASYTGQAAAYALAKRLVQKKITAEVMVPEKVGTDWADQ